MTDQDTTPSITEASHERDSDGELLATTETVEIHDQAYEVEIYPATTGQRNEWTKRLEDEPEELSDELTAELLDEFAVHEPEDFGADSWDDVRPAVTDALGNAVLATLFDAGDPDVFVEALEEAAQGATEGNQA
ncbi:hypothetical protein [Natrinema amylolyticum]|uniref:hypothetical protein n=1 Tax=Natrinema amylolyticum TaxID=2878679 RepID=UPI001CF9AE7E|nr:hypothetical protein [Natrinema amylolyticum]